MPIIRQSFSHTGLTKEASISWGPIKNYKNATLTHNMQKTATTYFYNDLISLLTQTNLLDSYDASKFSFKIFNEEFFCSCFSYTGSGINGAIAAAPRVFQDKLYDAYRTLVHSDQWSSNSLVDNTYNSNTWCGFNIFESMLNRDIVRYEIRVFYNVDYVLVQFTGASGQLNPLFCIVKGSLINSSTDIIYICGCPNAIYDNTDNNWVGYPVNTYNVQGVASVSAKEMCVEHYMKADGKFLFSGYTDGYEVFNYSGSMVYWMSDREDRLNIDLRHYQNKDAFYIKDATCFNAQISFDNMKIGDKKMEYDKFYKIGEDTYYVPGNQVVTNNNASRKQTGWPTFIFKI